MKTKTAARIKSPARKDALTAYPMNPDEALRLAMNVKPPASWKSSKRVKNAAR